MRGSQPVGALNITYLRETLTKSEAEKRLLPPLRKAASEIASNLTLAAPSTERAPQAMKVRVARPARRGERV
jgi:hypothetical protein